MLNLQISPQLLTDLTTIFQTEFGEDLKGLYLWGSAVSGDFAPTASDLDLLVVLYQDLDMTAERVAPRVLTNFLTVYPDWRGRLEIICLDQPTLTNFRTGGSLFHLSRNQPWQHEEGIEHWLRSWYLARQSAQALWGPPIETVIPVISDAEFQAAVRASALELSQKEVTAVEPSLRGYFVLTMCRAWITLQTGKLPSKAAAAAEVSGQKPQWAALLAQAQENHRTAGRRGLIEPSDCVLAQAFLQELGQEITGGEMPPQ
jgi:hypothetical protein